MLTAHFYGGLLMVNPDLHLWRAVLHMGLMDAARGADPGWMQSPDFALVCHLAQVDPAAVLRCYRPERFLTAKKAA